MPELPALLTTGEVAAALRVTRQTVSQWARDGRLIPAAVPGRSLRFRREDIEAMLTAPAERAS